MTTIRELAEWYHELTGEAAYQGEFAGVHHFVDGTVRGDRAARQHMQRLLDNAHQLTPDGFHWVQPFGSNLALLVDDNGTAVRTAKRTEHPWRES